MSIAINKEASKPAVLLFAGLDMASSFTSPVTIKKNSSSTVTINALEGFENQLTDAALNNADIYGATADGGDGTNEAFAESAVIKAKAYSNLTVTGNGLLKLNCNSKNAVKVGEYGFLTISLLRLQIDSVGHGLSCDNTIQINSGTIDISAQNDAIRSDPDSVNAESGCSGTINISGGTFNLKAGGDCIQAAQDITISGGNFDIQTGSGYDDSSFDSNTMSCKGIKASCNADDTSESTNTIEISGGTFNLNTADDAIHSDGYIVITGGTFTIKTGDDGVHADTSLTLGTDGAESNSSPNINITNSYEGLEAGNVYIYSGKYKVTASDDGINAAGDSGSQDFNPGGGPGRPGQGGSGGQQTPGGNSSSNNDYNINIYGGYIYVNVDGDGLDSNGNINLSGGTIISWGQKAGGDNEPLDCDGSLTINGATVFAAGSGAMITTPSSSSQKYIQNRSTNIQSGKIINVMYNNSVIFNITAVKNINYILYSSPDMTSTNGWNISNGNGELSVPSNLFSAINGAVAESSTMTFYGVAPGISGIDNYIETADECTVECTETDLGFGTGTIISVYYNYEKIYDYTLIIFGDINGDGMYDSQDAIMADCITKSLLTQGDIGFAKYLAADCNRDGIVDENDVDILNRAGLLLSEIAQSDTESDAYNEYLELINQSYPAESENYSEKTQNIFETIIEFIVKIYNYLLSLIS